MKKLFLLFIMITVTAVTHAQKPEIFGGKSGAINGYDPVAYFTENKPVKGNTKFTYKWKQADWYFTTNENMEKFKASPEKYEPQYGGYCAFGTSQGYKAPTEPEAFTIVDGKLYLNYSQKVMGTWRKDEKALIEKADMNWQTLKIAKE